MFINAYEELQAHEATIQDEFNIPMPLNFKKLNGGICNSPVYVFSLDKTNNEIPLGVFKAEVEELDFARKRFAALDEMTNNGFTSNPKILKNKNGDYLTKFGSNYYSVIEYLPADTPIELGFVDMLEITSCFHQYAQPLGVRNELHACRYHLHMSRQHMIDEVTTFKFNTNFFKTKEWKAIEAFYRFFAGPYAKQLFALLPRQFIIGDNHQENLIVKGGKPYFIDLDARRYDLRLYDFTSFIRHGNGKIWQEFIALTQQGKLFEKFDKHYSVGVTPLNEDEKNHFYLILGFSFVEFFSWVLTRLKQEKNETIAKSLFSVMLNKANCVAELLQSEMISLPSC